MSQQSAPPTVADAFLEALAEAGVDYLFTVLGSDHPSIIEAYVRRQNDPARQSPKMILFQHEFVAMSAADGYARISHKPACVLAHVDVGTAALGQGLHNASSGRAPVIIFAGVAPSTLHGEAPGSRSEHVQWYQDIRDQAAIVAPYSRFSAEIKSPHNVSSLVHRAVLMATTGSPGPVYLTATREILATPVPSLQPRPKPIPSCLLGSLPHEAVELIGNALLDAKSPLVVTGYLGRNHRAVQELIKLADTIHGLRVFDSELREVCFPATHPACVTRGTGAAPAVQSADVILVLDADVPWIPRRVHPSPDAEIYHIDLDPRKERMNMFDIGAAATFHADTSAALSQLNAHIAASPRLSDLQTTWTSRAESLRTAHAEGRARIDARATKLLETPDAPCTVDFLCSRIRALVPDDTIYVTDSVTNQVAMTEQLQLTRPGSHLTKGGSGLGWAGGASIGVKLASARYNLSDRPSVHPKSSNDSPFICSITGDGSFVFSVPTAVYWAGHRYGCPYLTVILNNGGWNATRQCLADVHPTGVAAGLSNADLGISLVQDGPDYGLVAKAAANGNLWTKRVGCVRELDGAIREGVRVVSEEGMSVVLDVIIA
ncbi:thiamine diphosphate-binding protein [Aspergillus sclerotioniger CBS 115572]|uniref:Thiamine diphosphate-binding protein n=1 Tax=Aspergillus sclerotioniger CBS 115572 TaxID=1450535 RepID=A0A317WNY4_9EURO|nr:thiamine diphosphate-binding protein [Aspergillus sclerotioniger CBS 115572]PWY88103.1 thiamine diphosphate-binding protein [Aspergillus sclerotioniger CBS 115572]